MKVYGEPVAAYRDRKALRHPARRTTRRPVKSSNVLVENDTDKRWFERQFMRVDWSKNLLPGFYGQTYNLNELLGLLGARAHRPVRAGRSPSFPTRGSRASIAWQCDGSGRRERRVHGGGARLRRRLRSGRALSHELRHPGAAVARQRARARRRDRPAHRPQVNWCARGPLLATRRPAARSSRYVRTSFLRVSDKRQYEPVNWVDSRFERFGYFRLEPGRLRSQHGLARRPGVLRDRLPQLQRQPPQHLEAVVRRERQAAAVHRARRAPDRLVHDARAARAPGAARVRRGRPVERSRSWRRVRKLRGQPLPTYPDVDVPDRRIPTATASASRIRARASVITPSCPGRYDPFIAARRVRRRHRGAVRLLVEVPEDAEPDCERSGARRRGLQRLVRRAVRRRRVRQRAARQQLQPRVAGAGRSG